MDTQQLLEQLRAGDTQPLKFLFEQYGAYCQRLLRRRTGCSVDEAHDVLMDALLVFRRNVLERRVTVVNHPKTYLYTICYYLYRAQRQRIQRQTAQQAEVERAWYDVRVEIPAHERLEEEASRRATQQQVWDAFQRLGDRCRQLLRYFYVENDSMQTIAQRMEFSSVGAVKTARYRCFAQWMRYWEERNK